MSLRIGLKISSKQSYQIVPNRFKSVQIVHLEQETDDGATVYASLYKSVFQYQLELSRFYSILFDFRLNIWNRTYYRTLFS